VEPITVDVVHFKNFYEGGSKEPIVFASPTWEPIKMDLSFLGNSFSTFGEAA